ncbi:MAG: TonB-dependent receptor [Candidatus Omnitrophica bacterium]|nr:TonB-dependent receptor [Candidatus Omnitrophota bacterium]
MSPVPIFWGALFQNANEKVFRKSVGRSFCTFQIFHLFIFITAISLVLVPELPAVSEDQKNSLGNSNAQKENGLSSSDQQEGAGIADVFKNQEAEPRWISPNDVMVTDSRLPGFQVPFGDVPANVSYIPVNVTKKERPEIYESYAPDFQKSVRDIESAVFYDSVGNGVDTTFSLRGFSEGSSVIFLVDGVRVNEVDGDTVTYPLLDMTDVESIQIDRGSASPIYGSGAFGGVVHLNTRQASEKPISLFGGFELSSHRGIRFHQGLSGTIQDRWTPLGGKFTYYFNGGRNVGEGFRDNGEYRITPFNIKTAYELPDEEGKIHFGFKHVDDAISNPGAITFDQYQADPEQTLKPLDGRDYRMSIVQLGADKNFFDNHVVASVLADWRVNLAHFYTTSVTFADGAFDPDTDLVTTKSRATDLIWQVAYQDDWDWAHPLTTVGMEFRDMSNYGEEQDAFLGNVVEDSPIETNRNARPRSTTLFWRETVRLFDRIIPHVGMSHSFHWLNTEDAITPTDSLSQRYRDSSLSTGLTVRPLSWMDLYGNYSQGFRVPTIDDLAPFSGTVSTSLRPEQTDSYETGLRLRLKNKGLLKFSYFLIDMKDEIAFDITSIGPTAPFGQNINIAKSRRTGVETRLDIQPLEELDFHGSYTLTKAYVRETDPTENLVDERPLGLIPAHRFTMGATVKPLARLAEPFNGLRISFLGTYTGRQHPVSYESTTQAMLDATGGAGHLIKGYSVWDFVLSYIWRQKEIYFKITNVFDEKYYSWAVDATVFPAGWGGSTVLPAGTYTFVNPGAPREYRFGVRYEI